MTVPCLVLVYVVGSYPLLPIEETTTLIQNTIAHQFTPSFTEQKASIHHGDPGWVDPKPTSKKFKPGRNGGFS